jgi:hypothetical protein
MKTLLFLFLFASFSFNCVCQNVKLNLTHGKDGLSRFSGKVFLISIGVDHYSKGRNIQYGQSDAQNFEFFIKKDKNINELKAFKMLDYSSKEQFIQHLNEIATEAKSADLFILYFAGMSINGAIRLSSDSISAQEIYAYSQNITCERQLFMFDTNNGDLFFKELKQIVKNKPKEKTNTNIDRVILSSKNSAYEGKNITSCDTLYEGGLLTGSVISSNCNLIDLIISEERRDILLTEFKSSIYNCMSNKLTKADTDLVFFSEKQFVDDFMDNEMNKRVIILENQESVANKKIKIERGETLSIILANQNFNIPSWYLPNTMNDAVKIESLLRSRYKTKTILLSNMKYQSFLDTLDKIYENYEFVKGSQLLFFAASHGLKDKRYPIGYLIFTDSDPSNLEPTSVEMQNLKRKLTSFGATSTLMLMDICHSGLAFSTEICSEPNKDTIPLNNTMYKMDFSSRNPLYKNYLNEKVNLFFSSSRDQEAADGTGPNSPFATVIIKFLEENKSPIIESYYLQEKINNEVFSYGAFSHPKFCRFDCESLPEAKFLFIKK